MIDTTLPQPGEHIPLPGQRSLLPDEPAGTEARAALRNWWLLNRGPEKPPKVESLRKLDLQCDVGRDRESWQMVRAAATEELGSLWARRYEWQQSTEFGGADDAIADEVNLMLARLCGPEPTPAKESTMPAAVARKTKTPKPAKTKPTKPAAVDTSTTAKPELAGELVMVDVDDLHPSPYQTRKPPTADWLKELGESLQRDGQLTPCLVRLLPKVGGYELIAGHTRKAAAKMIGGQWLQCRVIECDDATARRLVLVENAKRRDLDVIEQAQALQGLVESYAEEGKSQRDLAAEIGMSQAEISNLTRLLTLPAEWQERLITGGISKTQARDLLPWATVKPLWPAIEREWKRLGAALFSRQFDGTVTHALREISRPMSGWHYDGTRSFEVLVKTGDAEGVQLDIRKVGTETRAFNVPLWETLQTAAAKKKADREAKRIEKAEASGTKLVKDRKSGSMVDSKKVQAEQFNKRLYRWKLRWLQAEIAKSLAAIETVDVLPLLLVWFSLRGSENCTERRQELADACGLKKRESDPVDVLKHLMGLGNKSPDRTKAVRETLQRWVLHSPEGYSTDMPPAFVELLADHLSIDIVNHWLLDREFLELLTTSQLMELADEWKLAAVFSKRGELVDWLFEHGKAKPCPRAVKGIKAVQLF